MDSTEDQEKIFYAAYKRLKIARLYVHLRLKNLGEDVENLQELSALKGAQERLYKGDGIIYLWIRAYTGGNENLDTRYFREIRAILAIIAGNVGLGNTLQILKDNPGPAKFSKIYADEIPNIQAQRMRTI